jgi:hypothetical protein
LGQTVWIRITKHDCAVPKTNGRHHSVDCLTVCQDSAWLLPLAFFFCFCPR